MASTIRAAMLHDALDLRIEKIPAPPLPPGHVAITPKFCGLCGSDLHFYYNAELAATLKQTHSLTGSCLPQCFGHEFAGAVAELGPGYSGELTVGDQVVVMATITDGNCWACINGHTNTCSQLGFVGIHGGVGGLSDRAIVPADLAVKLPHSIDCEAGALIEPVAVAWHSLKKPEPPITTSTSALVIGAGPVGCAVILCLKAHGINTIVVSEPSAMKRDFALRLGASSVVSPAEIPQTLAILLGNTKRLFDVVFDCAGVPGKTLETAVLAVRSQGTIVNLAVQPSCTIPLLDMLMKEVQLKFSLAYTREDYLEVIHAIDQGTLDPRPLITKKIRLEDVVQEGFVTMHDADSRECKILIDLGL